MNRTLMEKAGFTEEMKLIEQRKCPLCSTKIDPKDFKDDLSVKEFTISGMCQKCQDRIFLSNREDE